MCCSLAKHRTQWSKPGAAQEFKKPKYSMLALMCWKDAGHGEPEADDIELCHLQELEVGMAILMTSNHMMMRRQKTSGGGSGGGTGTDEGGYRHFVADG